MLIGFVRSVSIASLTVTNSKRRVVAHVVPNAYPATKVSASHDASDQSIVEYVQVRNNPLLPL